MKIGIVVRRVMVFGAIVITAIIGCGGDDKVTNGDEEPVTDVMKEPVKLIPQNPKPSPMPLEEDEQSSQPEPQPEEPEAVEPEPEKPQPVEPRPEDEQPEPQPEEPEAVEPEPEPEPEPPVEEDVFLDRARYLLNIGKPKLRKELEENPDELFDVVADKVYREVFGFGFRFVAITLMDIHLEENPKEREIFPKALDPLILEYLRLSFKPPEKNEEELLELFRLSSREGNISVINPGQRPK